MSRKCKKQLFNYILNLCYRKQREFEDKERNRKRLEKIQRKKERMIEREQKRRKVSR